MRRWIAGVFGVGLIMVVSGCHTPPPGIDGELTDEWTVIGEAKQHVPETGHCHSEREVYDTVMMLDYEPVACTASHFAETVHVGTFTGAAASKADAPVDGSAELKQANQECVRQAKGYLGGEVLSAWLDLRVLFPTTKAWSGGARWFRCDVLEINPKDPEALVTRTASLKGALTKASALQLGCFQYTTGNDESLVPLACNTPHNAEFVGVLPGAEIAYPDNSTNKGKEYYTVGCTALIAGFLKATVSSLERRGGYGMVWIPPSESNWANGLRGTTCFLWLDKKKVSKSLRGGGVGSLP